MIEISKLTQKITHRHYKTIFILTLVLSTRKNNVKKLHFSCNERYFHSPMNHLLVRKHFPVYNCISFSISQNFVNYHCCRSVRYKKSIFFFKYMDKTTKTSIWKPDVSPCIPDFQCRCFTKLFTRSVKYGNMTPFYVVDKFFIYIGN